MYKMSGYVPGHILRMMYYSLFYPRLIYGLFLCWADMVLPILIKLIEYKLRALSLIEERYCTNIPLPLQKSISTEFIV